MDDVKPPSNQEKNTNKKVKVNSKISKWWLWPVKIFFLLDQDHLDK